MKIDSANSKAIEGIEEAERISEEFEEKKRKIDELNTSAQQLYDEAKYHEALDKWREVLNLNSKNQKAKEGIKTAEEKLKGREGIMINGLSSRAQKLFEERRYAEASAKWGEVLKLDPENRKAIKGIREANRILEKLQEGKRKIDALKISAQRLHDKGKYSEAIDKWKEVLNLDSENQTAKEGIKTAEEKLKGREGISGLSSQAQRLFEEKRYAEASVKWGEVLKLDSANSKAIEGIEEAERILKERELEELAQKRRDAKTLLIESDEAVAVLFFSFMFLCFFCFNSYRILGFRLLNWAFLGFIVAFIVTIYLLCKIEYYSLVWILFPILILLQDIESLYLTFLICVIPPFVANIIFLKTSRSDVIENAMILYMLYVGLCIFYLLWLGIKFIYDLVVGRI